MSKPTYRKRSKFRDYLGGVWRIARVLSLQGQRVYVLESGTEPWSMHRTRAELDGYLERGLLKRA